MQNQSRGYAAPKWTGLLVLTGLLAAGLAILRHDSNVPVSGRPKPPRLVSSTEPVALAARSAPSSNSSAAPATPASAQDASWCETCRARHPEYEPDCPLAPVARPDGPQLPVAGHSPDVSASAPLWTDLLVRTGADPWRILETAWRDAARRSLWLTQVRRTPADEAVATRPVVSVVVAPVEASAVAGPTWPAAAELTSRLHALVERPSTRAWASEALDQLDLLAESAMRDPAAFDEVLLRLIRHTSAADGVIARADSEALRAEVRRAQYALVRRLDVWRPAQRLAVPYAARAMVAQRGAGTVWVGDIEAAALDPRGTAARTLSDGTLRLVDRLERYEQDPATGLARSIAAQRIALETSPDPRARQLADHVETHYRNANLRVSVSRTLVDRMLPQPPPMHGEVFDVIAGVPVQGEQVTFTRLIVRMVPDGRAIRLGLEAHGSVASETFATSGPATFFNHGRTWFVARKLVLFDGSSVRYWPSVANAESATMLRGIRTDFDPVPLVGSLVKSVARSQHDSRRWESLWEVEQKAATRARDELDRQADARLAQLQQNYQRMVIEPLERLGLQPTPIGLATTEDRAIVRYRLAGHDQLAAHTPRPRAPADSLLSYQVHESAVNNSLERLELAGRTIELKELFHLISGRLGNPSVLSVPDDLPENVTVTFAADDPIRVRFADGRVEVALRIAEIVAERGRFRDLTIRALYEPEVDGRQAVLARNEGIRLASDQISTRSSIALRGIFSKLFSRNRRLPLVPEQVVNDARLADLRVTQLVIHDGWIGVAFGSQPAATVSIQPAAPASSGDTRAASDP